MASRAIWGRISQREQPRRFYYALGHTVQAATRSEARALLRKVRGGRALPPGTELKVVEPSVGR